MDCDYTIVAAWYDVREKENNPDKENPQNNHFCLMHYYFESAKPFFQKPFPMVIFTEPRFQTLIMEARPKELHEKTKFVFRDYEELMFYEHFPKYEENHHKRPIHNLDPHKFTPLYKFIINQKVNFVQEVIQTNPFQTSMFAWMDMRLHCVYDMPIEETNQVMSEMPRDRVKLMQMSFTHPVNDRVDFYYFTRGKVAAGFFGGHAEPLLRFCQLCQKEWIDALESETAPTDEMVYAYVISHHRDLFQPYVGEYGECLKNQLRIRYSHHLVFPFLETVFDQAIYPYAAHLSELIRRGYLAGEFPLSTEQIHKAWYYGYVSNYWLQNRDFCCVLLNQYFDLAKNDENVANYIRGMKDFLKHNIGYLYNDDLNNRLDSI
jgi:hypothetical protein